MVSVRPPIVYRVEDNQQKMPVYAVNTNPNVERDNQKNLKQVSRSYLRPKASLP
jgi:hypothetical protein